jgi:hypothetical protein
MPHGLWLWTGQVYLVVTVCHLMDIGTDCPCPGHATWTLVVNRTGLPLVVTVRHPMDIGTD